MERRVGMSHYAMYYGLYFGAILSVLTVVTFVTSNFDGGSIGSGSTSLITMVVFIGGIVTFGSMFRRRDLGDVISYGKALHFSISLCFYASLIVAFVSFIYFKWIDTTYLVKALKVSQDATLQLMQQFGMETSDIDKMIESFENQPAPTALTSALNQIFTNTVLGGVIALFTSFVIRRNPPIFITVDENQEQL